MGYYSQEKRPCSKLLGTKRHDTSRLWSGYMRQEYLSKKWPFNLGEELLPVKNRVGEKL